MSIPERKFGFQTWLEFGDRYNDPDALAGLFHEEPDDQIGLAGSTRACATFALLSVREAMNNILDTIPDINALWALPRGMYSNGGSPTEIKMLYLMNGAMGDFFEFCSARADIAKVEGAREWLGKAACNHFGVSNHRRLPNNKKMAEIIDHLAYAKVISAETRYLVGSAALSSRQQMIDLLGAEFEPSFIQEYLAAKRGMLTTF
jgi:hypothetical protein